MHCSYGARRWLAVMTPRTRSYDAPEMPTKYASTLQSTSYGRTPVA
jgi:hypothetical protein